MIKTLRFLTVAVDILLLIDIASDLVRKYQERKARKATETVSTEEEPEPAPEA